ncbi:peptide-methionine (S)-S-oxide reductase MsrA [Sphingomonas sp.]|uniref:peptide-methionine (S)-S-oxide reductase MsrA n=1 Tax=Sphingomonas sp. TaxID=28214 RepID=UPI0025FFED2E|nr:peptide-methionine (S)-S-oxide reductase MsrA [Sphingomonas sp.]
MTLKAKLGLSAIAAAAIAAPLTISWSGSAEAATNVPPAALVVPATGHREVAVLAGGCFWGIEGVYEHVKGVSDVTSGFAGARASGASYEQVSTGTTGNAEAVRIVFDPTQVSYAQLLRIFFSVAHDPTEVNRQGPDTGPQYRSAIFPQNPAQARVARAYIAQLGKAHVFGRPIATRIESGGFTAAEAYHQDFMRKNPNYPYIVFNDRPKVAALKQQFPNYWRG